MTDNLIAMRDLLAKRLDRRTLVGGTAAGLFSLSVVDGRIVVAGPGGKTLPVSLIQDDGSTILIGTLGRAPSINPFAASESESNWRSEMLFDQFVRVDYETAAAAPGLAASWEVNDLTYTFAIQPNATFHDGTDVTAEDVKFTIEGILNPQTASIYANKFSAIKGADTIISSATPAVGTPESADVSGIEVVDAKTLRITLSRAEASFLYNLHWVYVVPKAQLEGQRLDRTSEAPFFRAPIGAGPYVFGSLDISTNEFVATANPSYWDTGKPAIQTLRHQVIADASSLANALQSGEIDGSLYADPSLSEQLQQSGNLEVLVPPFQAPNGTVFNCRVPPFDKVEVRRAVAMAVNVEAYVNDSLLGVGQAGLGPIAPGLWAHDPTLSPIPYDPEAARAVFEANGMVGQTYEIITNAGNILREDWCIRVQNDLKELGVNIDFNPIEYTTVVERINQTRDFQLDAGDFAGATLDPNDLFDQFYSSSPTNDTGYANPELDALLEQARETVDQEAAKPIWSQVQQILMRDVPMHWAWYRPFISVVDNQYSGYSLAQGDGGLFRTLPNMTLGAPSATTH